MLDMSCQLSPCTAQCAGMRSLAQQHASRIAEGNVSETHKDIAVTPLQQNTRYMLTTPEPNLARSHYRDHTRDETRQDAFESDGPSYAGQNVQCRVSCSPGGNRPQSRSDTKVKAFPYPCPNTGCSKMYRQRNGLRYHLKVGQCSGSTRERITPRYRCPRPGCTKEYSAHNGLKYHLRKGKCTPAPFYDRPTAVPSMSTSHPATPVKMMDRQYLDPSKAYPTPPPTEERRHHNETAIRAPSTSIKQERRAVDASSAAPPVASTVHDESLPTPPKECTSPPQVRSVKLKVYPPRQPSETYVRLREQLNVDIKQSGKKISARRSRLKEFQCQSHLLQHLDRKVSACMRSSKTSSAKCFHRLNYSGCYSIVQDDGNEESRDWRRTAFTVLHELLRLQKLRFAIQSSVKHATYSKIICACYCSNPLTPPHYPGYVVVPKFSVCHGRLEIKVEADLSHPVPGILGQKVTVTIEHPKADDDKGKIDKMTTNAGEIPSGRTMDVDAVLRDAFGYDSDLTELTDTDMLM